MNISLQNMGTYPKNKAAVLNYPAPKRKKSPIFSAKVILMVMTFVLILLSSARVMAQTDATLSALTINDGALSPGFDPANLSYSDAVGNAVTGTTVTATTNDPAAAIMINGAMASSGAPFMVSLSVGSNPVNIVVTAADNTTSQTYTITITRAAPSTDATLSNLTISAGTLAPVFSSGNLPYTASVSNATNNINVTATTNDANATIKINGTPATSGTAFPVGLAVGANTISIVVTAQDNTTSQTYTIHVTRAAPSTDAKLSNLTISAGTLTPGFNSGHLPYTASVSNATTSIDVTPTTNDANATVTIGGVTATSGTPFPVSLSIGSNLINVVVTAQDGTTAQTYTITVTRPSTDATLSNLTISAGTLTPGFSSGNLPYTASVSNTTTSINVTATTNDAGATIKIGGTTVTSGTAFPVSLSIGSNLISIVVTAQDGTTAQTYTITVTRPSTDASLSNLTISAGTLTPGFSSGNLPYTASVSNATTSINVTPTTNDAGATIKIGGTTTTSGTAFPVSLSIGSNLISIVVTAQDGTTAQTYTITVTRPSTDATLSNLTISAGTLNPGFSSGHLPYTASVGNGITSINVTPTTNDGGATIKIGGVTTTSGTPFPVSLSIGSNLISIAVTAQDGATSQTYTINVTRAASSVATLSSLTISAGTLTPAFASGTTSYTDAASNATTSVTVNPTTSDATARITVNGTAVTSGTASTAIPLAVGPNTITTVVTAQDGTTTDTYTITVTRAPSAIATLSNLTISSGTLTPAFASGITSYTDAASNAITSVTVTPTTSDATATITVNGTAVTSGTASTAIPLVVGPNTITTVVTAQDGTTTDTYTITVTRAPSAIATLSNLTISSGTLTPAFASGTTSYTDAVSNATTSVTVTPATTDATSTIKVNGTAVTSGTASTAIPLVVGPNTITTVVTAQDGTTTDTYTITVTRAPSAIATLSNLTISSGTLTPAFASGTTSYTDAVSNATTSVTVTPATTDATSTIKVNGTVVTSGTASTAIPLAVGPNTITTVVTAQDGTTTDTYTITVTRGPSAIATLSNLTISSGTLTPAFASGTTSYTASVSNATTSITVTPTTSDATATVTVNGTTVASGTPSGAIALTVGPNVITMVVTAQNGTTTGTYTITVTRVPSAVATLTNLTISSGTLTPAFASGTISYTDAVTNATTSVTVTPTTSSATATVRVNGITVTSGTASAPIPLIVGTNVITTVVTAQDGTTTDTYTITLSRAPSASASLSNLVVSTGTLTPAFSSGTTSYTDAVSNATTSITVTPTTSDPNATVTVNGTPVASGTASAPIALLVGPNVITTVVTAQDGVTKGTYNLTVTRGASTDATLSNLTISAGTLAPVFASGTISYAASVDNATTSTTVTPTTNNANATVTVNGTTVTSGNASAPIALAVGPNVITIRVTAQDGTTTDTYSIAITRAPSADATLNNLAISSGTLTPTFASGVFSYTAQVGNTITSITVTPTASNPAATVTVNGASVASGTASGPIALQFGPNVITTVVTAQDGTTKGIYTITVTRAVSSVSTLSNLTISSGTLAPAFTTGTTSYAASVSNATTSVTVTPTVTDPAASITVDGTAVASGAASGPIALQVGSNVVTIVVTAQDGITASTYTVTVDRPALTAVTLSSLTISTGSLAPAFGSGIFSYASAVGNATTSLTVTATTSDATATLTVNGITVGSGSPSGPIALQVGANVITVVVKAQNGLTTTYTITVARAGSTDALLSDLVLSNGTLSPVFGSKIDNYTASVDNGVSELTLTPIAADVNATIKVNGILVNSGSPSGLINLPLDYNTITVVVTAPDGTTTQTYTVIVHRGVNQAAVLANNILTPNGDGKNDTWMVKNILLFPNNTVTVYDHSGKVVYSKKGYSNDWDGTFQGSPLNEDTYYYYIDLGPGERKIKGFITVIKRR